MQRSETHRSCMWCKIGAVGSASLHPPYIVFFVFIAIPTRCRRYLGWGNVPNPRRTSPCVRSGEKSTMAIAQAIRLNRVSPHYNECNRNAAAGRPHHEWCAPKTAVAKSHTRPFSSEMQKVRLQFPPPFHTSARNAPSRNATV